MAPFPYWRYVSLARERAVDASVAALRVAVDELIAAARARLAADPARRQHPANLLEAMPCAAQDDGHSIDDNSVAGNVATLLLAGEDTTGSALCWLLYLLHSNPLALRRAREEVLRVAPDPEQFTIEQMNALDYLDACAREALRLKPPTPFIPLEALCDSVVGDVAVPKGGLLWCVMRQHHDVPPGSDFDPGRWLGQEGGASEQPLLMPFGAGPRTCSGRYLALLEIKVACAMLLGSFEMVAIDTQDGKEPLELMGFTMSPQGLRMRLRERSNTLS